MININVFGCTPGSRRRWPPRHAPMPAVRIGGPSHKASPPATERPVE